MALVEEVLHERLSTEGGRLVLHVPGGAAEVRANWLHELSEPLGSVVFEFVVAIFAGFGVKWSHSGSPNVILSTSL